MGADDHEAVHDSARAVGSLAERNHWFSHRANDCTVRPIGVSRQTCTGTLSAIVEGVDLWTVLGAETDNTAFSLVGRNDFVASNPPLPYRLLDGDAVRWLTKVETIENIVRGATKPGLTVTRVSTRVRLGTGEAIKSELLSWTDLA